MAAEREVISYNSKKVIFNYGDVADCMYRIEYGIVDIYLNYKKPQQKCIATLSADQYFGEMGLLDGTLRSATAVARTDDTTLTVFRREQLQEILSNDCGVFRGLLSQMSENLFHLTGKYLDVCRTLAEYESASLNGGQVDPEVQKDIDKYADLYQNT